MTEQRDKIIRYYKANNQEDLAARLIDLAQLAIKTKKYKISDFLDPYGLSIAETIVAHYPILRLEQNGGFNTAERVKVAFVHQDYQEDVIYDIDAIKTTWDKRFYSLSHRDVLGALLGLGCEREVMGDIVFDSDGAQFVVKQSMTKFFLDNLVQIGAANVSTEQIPISDLVQKEETVKEIKATVAALRLDAVAAAGYSVSRSKMADEIKAQRVKINWQEAKSPSQSVNAGDIISFRSRGRLEVVQINGTTKKGRISVFLRRYI